MDQKEFIRTIKFFFRKGVVDITTSENQLAKITQSVDDNNIKWYVYHNFLRFEVPNQYDAYALFLRLKFDVEANHVPTPKTTGVFIKSAFQWELYATGKIFIIKFGIDNFITMKRKVDIVLLIDVLRNL